MNERSSISTLLSMLIVYSKLVIQDEERRRGQRHVSSQVPMFNSTFNGQARVHSHSLGASAALGGSRLIDHGMHDILGEVRSMALT